MIPDLKDGWQTDEDGELWFANGDDSGMVCMHGEPYRVSCLGCAVSGQFATLKDAKKFVKATVLGLPTDLVPEPMPLSMEQVLFLELTQVTLQIARGERRTP